jgi:hypothetical protein
MFGSSLQRRERCEPAHVVKMCFSVEAHLPALHGTGVSSPLVCASMGMRAACSNSPVTRPRVCGNADRLQALLECMLHKARN